MRYDRVMARLKDYEAENIEIVGDVPSNVSLSEQERHEVDRPPTPQRPRPGKKIDLFDVDSPRATGPSSLPTSPTTPKNEKVGLFLSDHFGLVVDIAPRAPERSAEL